MVVPLVANSVGLLGREGEEKLGQCLENPNSELQIIWNTAKSIKNIYRERLRGILPNDTNLVPSLSHLTMQYGKVFLKVFFFCFHHYKIVNASLDVRDGQPQPES